MTKMSVGILLYRPSPEGLQFLLVHPGGPFFARKDAGWWTVPKGEPGAGEDPLKAAVREFEEETGYKPGGPFTELTPIRQKAGKVVRCWAAPGDLDATAIVSNTFEMPWPPKSGKLRTFPEVDKAGWFTLEEALRLINERQQSFLTELQQLLQSAG